MLFDRGQASMSVVDLFNDCRYIPSSICEDRDEIREEYDPLELSFEDE
jgi:hypothetical protein